MPTTADLVGKDIVIGAGGDAAAVNGHDLEQQDRREQELPPPAAAAAADHGSKRLAIGRLIKELVMEGVATFVVIFWSCTAALLQGTHHSLSFPMVCLVVALTVALVLGWIGPAHLNPAVTLTFAAFRVFPWRKLPLYAATQLAASVLACLAVNALMRPRHGEDFYGTVPMAAAGQGNRLPFVFEFLGSAVLMIVIATAARAQRKVVGGVAIGAAVGTLGLVIGPVSGGSMNPVRSLGPAIVMGRYESVWIYVVAPVSGMLLGALCNKAVRQADDLVEFLCRGGGGGRSGTASGSN